MKIVLVCVATSYACSTRRDQKYEIRNRMQSERKRERRVRILVTSWMGGANKTSRWQRVKVLTKDWTASPGREGKHRPSVFVRFVRHTFRKKHQ